MTEGITLVRFDRTMFLLDDFSNMENILALNKLHDLVNMSGLLKTSLKGPCFTVMRNMTN